MCDLSYELCYVAISVNWHFSRILINWDSYLEIKDLVLLLETLHGKLWFFIILPLIL